MLALSICFVSFTAFAAETIMSVCECEVSETKNKYLLITSSTYLTMTSSTPDKYWEAVVKATVKKDHQSYTLEGVGVAVGSTDPDRVEKHYKLIVSTLGINPRSGMAVFYVNGKAQGEGFVLEPVITVRPSEEPRPKGYVRIIRCADIEI